MPQVAPFPTTQSSKKQAAPLLTPVGNRWSSFAWCKKFLISQTLLIFGLLFQVQWFNTALTKVKLLAEPTMVRSSLSSLSSTVWAKTSNSVNKKNQKTKNKKKKFFWLFHFAGEVQMFKFSRHQFSGVSKIEFYKKDIFQLLYLTYLTLRFFLPNVIAFITKYIVFLSTFQKLTLKKA